MSEKTILVSACLLGTPCRYDGKSKPHRLVQAFLKASHARVIPICPEVMGGLLTPRPPAEIQPDGRVRTQSGLDVTDAYDQGAEKVLHLAQKEGADLVILQAKSPSCGVSSRYDGSFTKTLVKEPGITARLLKAHGLQLWSRRILKERIFFERRKYDDQLLCSLWPHSSRKRRVLPSVRNTCDRGRLQSSGTKGARNVF